MDAYQRRPRGSYQKVLGRVEGEGPVCSPKDRGNDANVTACGQPLLSALDINPLHLRTESQLLSGHLKLLPFGFVLFYFEFSEILGKNLTKEKFYTWSRLSTWQMLCSFSFSCVVFGPFSFDSGQRQITAYPRMDLQACFYTRSVEQMHNNHTTVREARKKWDTIVQVLTNDKKAHFSQIEQSKTLEENSMRETTFPKKSLRHAHVLTSRLS